MCTNGSCQLPGSITKNAGEGKIGEKPGVKGSKFHRTLTIFRKNSLCFWNARCLSVGPVICNRWWEMGQIESAGARHPCKKHEKEPNSGH